MSDDLDVESGENETITTEDSNNQIDEAKNALLADNNAEVAGATPLYD
jgi:hypothetical protein